MAGTLMLNGVRATMVQLLMPFFGVWVADVDLDPDLPTIPSGKVALTIGTSSLVGTVDARSSGKFGEKGKARVVAGGGGWEKTIGPQPFDNKVAVLSSSVLASTAAEVGEQVVDTAPVNFGRHYIRHAGPASSVLAGRDWYVNAEGVTIVGPRALVPMTPAIEVLGWDPIEQRAELASDAPIFPGTILVDPKFGPVTVRDVAQTFSSSGARAKAWCSSLTPKSPGGRVAQALSAFAKQAVGASFVRKYRYRIVEQEADKRFVLQAVKPTTGIPDVLPIAYWPAVAGLKCEVGPGTTVVVEFLEGDPSLPIVTHYETDAIPVQVTLGTAVRPAATYPELATWAAAVVSACAAHVPPITIPPLPASVASTKFLTE